MAEGAESVLFTQFFKNWKRKDQTEGFGKAYSTSKIAKIDKVVHVTAIGNTSCNASLQNVVAARCL